MSYFVCFKFLWVWKGRWIHYLDSTCIVKRSTMPGVNAESVKGNGWRVNPQVFTKLILNEQSPEGGYFHQNCTWMCLRDLENLTFSIPIFCQIFPVLKEKHPILIKLGAFYNDLSKIQSIYVIWAPSSLMKNPIAIPNFAKRRPKRQAHIRIPCQCENPQGTKITSKLIQTAKEQYFRDKLHSADSKTMFTTLDKVLNKTVKHLPECDSMTGLCNEFAVFFFFFFNEKVAVIRNDLDMILIF